MDAAAHDIECIGIRIGYEVLYCTYMRWRLMGMSMSIRAVGGLLRSGRLPMSWELMALTALMREHLESLRGESDLVVLSFRLTAGGCIANH